MKSSKPSALELQVLAVLWQRGPSTVREVLEAMPDGKPRAYTTVLSIMQVMEKKGLLTHKAQGKAHVYRPSVARQKVLGPLLGNLVDNVFGGSSSGVLQCLMQERGVSAGEFAEIQQLLAEHDKPRRKKGKG